MEAQKFIAPNMSQGLKTIREVLGEDAMIISKTKTEKGIEIIAGIAKEPHYQALNQSSMDVLIGAQTKQKQDLLLDTYKENMIDKPYGQGKVDQTLAHHSVKMEPVYHNAQVLEKFQSEITSIRHILDKQAEDLCWQQFELKNALKVTVIKSLMAVGFSQSFAKQILEPMPNHVAIEALHQAANQSIIEQLCGYQRQVDWGSHIHVITGPGGSGKTKGLCKLLPHVLNHVDAKDVLLVSYNENRLGQFDSLMVFANIFGVQSALCDSPESLSKVLSLENEKQVVLIDLASDNLRHAQQLIAQFIGMGLAAKPMGVLAGHLEPGLIARWASALHEMGANHLVATKLDETTQIGTIIEQAIKYGMSLDTWFASAQLTESYQSLSPESLCQILENRENQV